MDRSGAPAPERFFMRAPGRGNVTQFPRRKPRTERLVILNQFSGRFKFLCIGLHVSTVTQPWQKVFSDVLADSCSLSAARTAQLFGKPSSAKLLSSCIPALYSLLGIM
jgi:hypothetical protein